MGLSGFEKQVRQQLYRHGSKRAVLEVVEPIPLVGRHADTWQEYMSLHVLTCLHMSLHPALLIGPYGPFSLVQA